MHNLLPVSLRTLGITVHDHSRSHYFLHMNHISHPFTARSPSIHMWCNIFVLDIKGPTLISSFLNNFPDLRTTNSPSFFNFLLLWNANRNSRSIDDVEETDESELKDSTEGECLWDLGTVGVLGWDWNSQSSGGAVYACDKCSWKRLLYRGLSSDSPE